MNCRECGRPAENGTPTHYLGCEYTAKAVAELDTVLDGMCDHPGCSEPKWSSGPRAKYCETHKDPKSREK